MPEIPDPLKWYLPLNIASGGLDVAWQMSVDPTTGCVRGAEAMEAEDFRMFGLRVWRAVGKRARVRSTQIFMLVLNQSGEWQRYNLADDHNSDSNKWKTSESGSKQFLQLADLLRQHLSFETFVKDYSLEECYEQQQ